MDWVFKASSSWELTEVERDEFDVLVMEKNQNMEDFCVDSGILEDWGLNEQKHSTESSFLSPPSKKPREQHVSCLVDGCTDDLSSCRDYHRRHRVCEAHSKTPVVVIGGKHQRFCQQCSRFHSVGEFDDVKRSCRKRLDGHNKRRRKPRGPESSVYLNGYNYGSFFTNHQGTKLLRFGGSPAHIGSPLRWPDREKLPVSKVTRATEIKFPFLLGSESDEQVVPGHTTAAQHLVGTQSVDPNTTAALSLLSKHNNTIHHNNNSHSTTPTSFDLPATLPNNHLIGMIQFRTQGFSLENQAPQLLSFSYNPH